MNDHSNRVSINDARPKLGDLVTAAQVLGRTTIITRNGRPAARLAPLEDTMPDMINFPDPDNSAPATVQVPATSAIALLRRGETWEWAKPGTVAWSPDQSHGATFALGDQKRFEEWAQSVRLPLPWREVEAAIIRHALADQGRQNAAAGERHSARKEFEQTMERVGVRPLHTVGDAEQVWAVVHDGQRVAHVHHVPEQRGPQFKAVSVSHAHVNPDVAEGVRGKSVWEAAARLVSTWIVGPGDDMLEPLVRRISEGRQLSAPKRQQPHRRADVAWDSDGATS